MGDQLLLDEVFNSIVTRFSLSEVLFFAEVPVERHLKKKNNRPIYNNRATGKSFIGKSKDLKAAEEYMTLAFKSVANKYKLETPIQGPIWCLMLFYFNPEQFYTKQGEVSKMRGDLSNLYELPQDCLQAAGIIVDDDQICSHDLSRRLPGKETKLQIYLLRHQLDFRPDDEDSH